LVSLKLLSDQKTDESDKQKENQAGFCSLRPDEIFK